MRWKKTDLIRILINRVGFGRNMRTLNKSMPGWFLYSSQSATFYQMFLQLVASFLLLHGKVFYKSRQFINGPASLTYVFDGADCLKSVYFISEALVEVWRGSVERHLINESFNKWNNFLEIFITTNNWTSEYSESQPFSASHNTFFIRSSAPNRELKMSLW